MCLYSNFAPPTSVIFVVFIGGGVLFFPSDLYSSPPKAFTVSGHGVKWLIACIDFLEWGDTVGWSREQQTLNFPLCFQAWRGCLEMTISIGMFVSFWILIAFSCVSSKADKCFHLLFFFFLFSPAKFSFLLGTDLIKWDSETKCQKK